MTHQFLILSYSKDFPWLRHCLRSLKRFSEGFLPPVIVVPEQDSIDAWEIVKSVGSPALVVSRPEPQGLGQLFSQVWKCKADEVCTADCIWFIDSDCLVFNRLYPELFLHNGTPIMIFNSYNHLRVYAPETLVWQKVVSENLGFQVENDYLRRMPMLYPRQLFPALRKHIEDRHRKPFADYVYGTGKNSWPQNFCESNVLGAFAHHCLPGIYHWSCLDYGGNWPNPVIQFWSHGGFDRPCDAAYSFSGGNTRGQTPKNIIEQVLGPDGQ